MKYIIKPLLFLLALSPLLPADESDVDFINFNNDDTLHGNFLGLTTSGKVIWKNTSAEKNIAFARKDLRKIVLNAGKITKPFSHISYVSLKDKDIIPGKITALTDTLLTIETDYAGSITIPREQITDINLHPLGNKVLYRGPFSEDEGWILKSSSISQSTNLSRPDDKKQKPWTFKNFSLTHKGSSCSILKKTQLPDTYRICFNSYNYQSYQPSLIIIADLIIPEYDQDDKEIQNNRNRYKSYLGNHLGTSLVARLRGSSASLIEYGFNENGSIYQNSHPNLINSVTTSRSQNTKTFYDLRVDIKSGLILLYSNKSIIGKWQLDEMQNRHKGEHFGFNTQYYNTQHTATVSDIIATSWNGIQDSALSLENESRDIIMLNNGTDRYSGKVTSISDGFVKLKSSYAEMNIPQEQISTINFASGNKEHLTPQNKNAVTIRFYGTGKITGEVSKSEDGFISLKSNTIGTLKIKSEFISSFEFTDMDYAYETSK